MVPRSSRKLRRSNCNLLGLERLVRLMPLARKGSTKMSILGQSLGTHSNRWMLFVTGLYEPRYKQIPSIGFLLGCYSDPSCVSQKFIRSSRIGNIDA
jgi:hypothetical protein